MPRVARVRAKDSSHHIMVRSIKELDLFQEDEDKMKYFALIKKYQLKYGFKVYAYCLMNNHGHLIIDPEGADISKIMHVINFSYARYFNKKYKRYGHVFQDRFKSKVVDSKRYMINLSAYIHNNPKDIIGYENNVKGYPFSSLKEYIEETNTFGILTRSLLVDLIGFKHKINKKNYINLVKESNNEEFETEIEFTNTETEYQSHKKAITKYQEPREIIEYVAKFLNQDAQDVHVKYKRTCTKIRALTCFLMSSFGNMKQKEICEVIGNITQSGVSYLANKGIDIVSQQEKSILDNFIIK